MESNVNHRETFADECGPLNLEHIENAIRYMETLLKELIDRVRTLPEVDKEGRSEYFMAEGLYALKEEAADKVFEQLKRLQEYPEPLNREISQCERNLELIRSDSSRLNLKHVKEEYEHVQGSLNGQYIRAVNQKEQISELISQAEEELRKANAIKWPLGEPKTSSYAPGSFSTGPKDCTDHALSDPMPLSHAGFTGSLNTEINSLMALGPLNGGLFR